MLLASELGGGEESTLLPLSLLSCTFGVLVSLILTCAVLFISASYITSWSSSSIHKSIGAGLARLKQSLCLHRLYDTLCGVGTPLSVPYPSYTARKPLKAAA